MREAPARITSSYGGFVACGACISSILPVHSIAQHISNFKTRTSRNIPADTDRARADLTDMHGQSVERGHALLVDDLRRAVLPECLVLQHEGLRREVKRVIGEVRRHQDADALRVEAQDETQEAVRVAEVEVRRWLVEDEELRLLRERRREQDELMLAARDVRIGLLREMSDAPPSR